MHPRTPANTRRISCRSLAVSGALVAALCGCEDASNGSEAPPTGNDVGGGAMADAAGGQDAAVGEDAAGGAPGALKIDFLFVMDQSPSMAGAQVALAHGIDKFVAALAKFGGGIDARAAVITAQQVPDKATLKIPGRFMYTPATSLPATAIARVHMACTSDDDCAKGAPWQAPQTSIWTNVSPSLCVGPKGGVWPAAGGGKGNWKCKGVSSGSLKTNTNCSLNSYCRSWCDATASDGGKAQCEALLGAGAICSMPTGTPSDKDGCLRPPPVGDCPAADTMPAVMSGADLGKSLRCAVSVGVAQTMESSFEGPLRAAWMALDADGPNCAFDACVAALRTCCGDGGTWCAKDKNADKCAADKKVWCDPLAGSKGAPAEQCQAKALLRQDARLVLIVLSDDDDASIAPNLNPLDPGVASKEVWLNAQSYGDAIAGNLELNEAACVRARIQDPEVVCPTDCAIGSKTVNKAGEAKCANGCSDGSADRKACLSAAEAGVMKFAKGGAKPTAGWQFAPIATWVEAFKGMKNNPSMVWAAVIAGDSLAGDETQRHVDRVAAYTARLKDVGPGQAPYLCNGPLGPANPSRRLAAFAKGFGDQGLFYNFCDAGDLGDVLAEIVTQAAK